MELGARKRADERQALAEGAAGVEVGRQRDGGTRVDERPRRRHRPVEEESARGEQDSRHVASAERPDAVGSRRLEVVDRADAEVECEWNRAGLAELVAVQSEREPCVAKGPE